MKLNVMSFNLRIDVEQDGENAWPHRVTEVANAIKAAGASVICTQEGTYAMLQQLKEYLPDYDWAGKGRRGGNEDEHCAIFYRRDMFEPIENGTFWLSETPERPGSMSWNTSLPRICTWVRLKQQDGKEWRVFNTHLDHISSEARTKGIQVITERIIGVSDLQGIPAVLAGDFNSDPDSDVINKLEQEGLHNAYSALTEKDAVGCTFHGFNGGETGEPIDYIFVTPDIRFESASIDRSMYNGRYPSDHYPVVAHLLPLS